IKRHNKPMLLNGIKRLKTSVQTNQENVKQLKEELQKLKRKLFNNSRNYSSNVAVLQSKLMADTDQLKEELKEIQEANKEMNKTIDEKKESWSKHVLQFVKNPWKAIENYFQPKEMSKINQIRERLNKALENGDTKAQGQVVELLINEQENISNVINEVIEAENNIINVHSQWDSIHNKYENMIKLLQKDEEVDWEKLNTDLDNSKQQWDLLQKELKNCEN
ncbi:HBL/NHE enterotoxin family protein, partial [Bacillus sp. 196mf]|uniref:HBL/NHE enterotoxin family protein n=1 Tax=Bacillus sp. 196mf TaxID=1761754 RepID=UPI000D84C711